jgi:hypothetical protein
MANADRLTGFRAVKSLNGAPVTQLIRQVGVRDGTDCFVGDAINLATGLAEPADTNEAIHGVAVAFGKVNSMTGKYNAYDPTSLDVPNYYDDSANTHTDWVCYYIPAEQAIFACQTDAANTFTVGVTCDILATAGSTTTGMSAHELTTTTSNGDCWVVEIPDIIDNDVTAANAEYWVRFQDTVIRAGQT